MKEAPEVGPEPIRLWDHLETIANFSIFRDGSWIPVGSWTYWLNACADSHPELFILSCFTFKIPEWFPRGLRCSQCSPNSPPDPLQLSHCFIKGKVCIIYTNNNELHVFHFPGLFPRDLHSNGENGTFSGIVFFLFSTDPWNFPGYVSPPVKLRESAFCPLKGHFA